MYFPYHIINRITINFPCQKWRKYAFYGTDPQNADSKCTKIPRSLKQNVIRVKTLLQISVPYLDL